MRRVKRFLCGGIKLIGWKSGHKVGNDERKGSEN